MAITTTAADTAADATNDSSVSFYLNNVIEGCSIFLFYIQHISVQSGYKNKA